MIWVRTQTVVASLRDLLEQFYTGNGCQCTAQCGVPQR